jgi:hypothetical protein
VRPRIAPLKAEGEMIQKSEVMMKVTPVMTKGTVMKDTKEGDTHDMKRCLLAAVDC